MLKNIRGSYSLTTALKDSSRKIFRLANPATGNNRNLQRGTD
jgi:hypothetical protein